MDKYETIEDLRRRLIEAEANLRDKARADSELREIRLRFALLAGDGPQAAWEADANGTIVNANKDRARCSGHPAGERQERGRQERDRQERNWIDTVHPEDRARLEGQWHEAVASHAPLDAEARLEASDGSFRWTHVRAAPLHDAAGRVEKWLGLNLDIDDRKRAELASREHERTLMRQQTVLVAELQHRARNILATIRSIASRTGTADSSIDEFKAHFDGRIAALARTQGVLTRTPGETVDLELLVRDELLAQAAQETRFGISGAPLRVSPKAAEVLALAIHELATNATKYGALYQRGRIEISWYTETRGREVWLVFRWIESGVAVAQPDPPRAGFGTEVMTRKIPYELSGQTEFDVTPAGVRAQIAFPLGSRRDASGAGAAISANA